MKKIVRYDKNAIDELNSFDLEVKEDFVAVIDILATRGRLEYPEGKKITKDIFEIRVKRQGIYRGFYAYIYNNEVVILHFFMKKTQKSPIKSIKLAEKRLKKYE